ncbi:hypothetical protein QUA44_23680 [Microcoleus sp. N9_A2]
MQSPGFEIYNGTIWPLQIALKQVGPLYYELVQPGQYFRRSTGAVWFTISASIYSGDSKDLITTWDCVWPVGAVVGTILFGALTGGYGAFVSAATFAAQTGIVAGISTAMASTLVAGGMTATSAIVVSGAVLGSVTSGVASSLLAKVFSSENSSASKMGCYAGPPYPFRKTVRTYKVTGGPTLQPRSDGKMELIGAPLRID